MTDPGTIIDDRYEVVRQLGEGGMGAVYVAIEIELNRQVAIKLLHPGFLADEEQRARFEREGRILSSLSHPNILTFFRFGTWRKTTPYIVMEYLDGVSLRDLIDEGSLSLSRCLDISLQMAQALQYAHNQNIVHRDIKPTNVLELLDTERTIKILDFGLARVVAGELPQHLTQTGDLIGSVFYMSPEQCTGKRADSRSDIYSLGCVLYEMCTREAPFKADNPIGLMHKHATEDVPPILARKELEADAVLINSLNGIIRKCMEKAPENRYQTMDELAADLRLLQQGKVDELKIQALAASRRSPTKLLLLASIILVPVVLLPFVFHSNLIDPKPVLPKREQRQQKPLGLQAQLSAILNQPSGHKRYLELKQFAEHLKSQNAENTVDIRSLYFTLCNDAEAAKDSDYIAANLERYLKQRMITNPAGTFTATMWDFLARTYAQQGDFEQAEAAARTALRIFGEEPQVDTRREIYSLHIVYQCMRFKQRKIQDRSILARAVKMALQSHFRLGVSLLSPELAYYYLLEGKSAEEKKLFDASLKSLAKAPYSDQIAYLRNLNSVFYQLGKSELCTTRIPAWLNIVASTPEPYSMSRFQAGETLIESLPLQALAFFDDVAPRLSLPKDKHLLACLTATRARTLLHLDRYEEAAKATKEAMELSTPTTCGYTMTLAIVCAQKDQFDLLERCLDQFDKAADSTFLRPQELVNGYRQLCEQLSPAYNGDRKLKYMQRCKSLALRLRKPCNPGLMHLLDIGIAQAYDKLGQHQEALDIVLKLLPEMKNDQIDCRINALGVGISSALYLSKTGTANTFLTEALNLIRLNPGEVYGAIRMKDLAMCYAETNHPEKAEQIFIASCNDRKTYGTLYDDAAIMLARFYNGTEQPQKALSILKKLDRPCNAVLIQRSDTLRWSQFEIETGVAYRILNQPGEALKHFRNASELAEKVDFSPALITARASEAAELIALQRASRMPDAAIEQILLKMQQDVDARRRGLAGVISDLEAQYLLNCNKRKEAAIALLRTVDTCKKHPSYESPILLLSSATQFEILGLRSEAVACRELATDYLSRIYGDSYTKVRVLRSAEKNDKRLRSQLEEGPSGISHSSSASQPNK